LIPSSNLHLLDCKERFLNQGVVTQAGAGLAQLMDSWLAMQSDGNTAGSVPILAEVIHEGLLKVW